MFEFGPRYIETRVMSLAKTSPELLPPCIVSEGFSCNTCMIGDTQTCLLLHDPHFLSMVRWRVANQKVLSDDSTPDTLIVAIMDIFDSHGLPLHEDKVISLLSQRNAELSFSRVEVRNTLKNNPVLFKQTDRHVYYLNDSALSGQEVPPDKATP